VHHVMDMCCCAEAHVLLLCLFCLLYYACRCLGQACLIWWCWKQCTHCMDRPSQLQMHFMVRGVDIAHVCCHVAHCVFCQALFTPDKPAHVRLSQHCTTGSC
jgi:hypothetical protein